MGRLAKNFPRFPHHCVIYAVVGATPFSDGERNVLWEGACRKESNTSIRTFKGTDNVIKSDYRIQLGESSECDANGAVVEGIVAGMFIDVMDRQGTFEGLVISDAYAGNLGTTIYCDSPKT